MSSLRTAIAMASLWFVPFTLAAQPAGAGANAAPTVEAIWVESEVEFTYMSFTTYYSCDGLRTKLRWLMKEIGARPDFKVNVTGCVGQGPEAMPRVKIKAALPQEATPELLAKLAEGAAQRELVARATGKPDAVSEPTARFPARPRRIELRDRSGSHVEDGDCDLVEQLRDKAFPQLGAKIVDDQMRCMANTVALGGVRLTIEVLEAVPAQ